MNTAARRAVHVPAREVLMPLPLLADMSQLEDDSGVPEVHLLAQELLHGFEYARQPVSQVPGFGVLFRSIGLANLTALLFVDIRPGRLSLRRTDHRRLVAKEGYLGSGKQTANDQKAVPFVFLDLCVGEFHRYRLTADRGYVESSSGCRSRAIEFMQ